MYDSKVADRLHYCFGCRIKENYLIEIRQSFLYFSYPSEKRGSRMYINQYEAVIINIVIEEMVKFSRNNFQGTSERSELIKLFIIYTRSLFLRHIRATFSHSLYYVFRGFRLCPLRIANRGRIKIAHPSEFYTSPLERIRSRFLGYVRAISTNSPPLEVTLTFSLEQNRRIVTNSKSWEKREEIEESVCSEIDKYLNKFNFKRDKSINLTILKRSSSFSLKQGFLFRKGRKKKRKNI